MVPPPPPPFWARRHFSGMGGGAYFEAPRGRSFLPPPLFVRPPPPKGPSRTVFSTESDSVVFNYSAVNLLRIVIHYSKYSKSVQNVVIHYIFSSESLRVVNSLQIVNSLRVLFLVCDGVPWAGPPLEAYFQGWGVGVYKIWPRNILPAS